MYRSRETSAMNMNVPWTKINVIEAKPVLAHIVNDENLPGSIHLSIKGELPSDLVVYISERSYSKYFTVENATWTFKRPTQLTIYPKD